MSLIHTLPENLTDEVFAELLCQQHQRRAFEQSVGRRLEETRQTTDALIECRPSPGSCGASRLR
ncbi:MAG: hypothetical protein WAW42_01210 [Candidatus Competibacteraceae bacterium]